MKINILFWNLFNKDLRENISNLVTAHNVHIFFFAEFAMLPGDLLGTLNRYGADYQYVNQLGCKKIEIFTRFPPKYLRPIKETSRMTIRRLNLPGYDEILLAALHFQSKQNWSGIGQALETTEVSRVVSDAEEIASHRRTILFGDFNMHPFEEGMVAASGLNGVMSRERAKKNHRTVNGRLHHFFYNPMWNFLGDSEIPYGSLYYPDSEQVNYYWGFLDQVLVRPDLLDKFDNNDLKVLVSDGENSLLTSNNIPNKNTYSDHLPILFSVEI